MSDIEICIKSVEMRGPQGIMYFIEEKKKVLDEVEENMINEMSNSHLAKKAAEAEIEGQRKAFREVEAWLTDWEIGMNRKSKIETEEHCQGKE